MMTRVGCLLLRRDALCLPQQVITEISKASHAAMTQDIVCGIARTRDVNKNLEPQVMCPCVNFLVENGNDANELVHDTEAAHYRELAHS